MRTPLDHLSRSIGFGLWLAAGLVHAALDAEGAARLAALQHDPQAAGEQVYQGHVFALDPYPGPQLFTYERRVTTSPMGLTAAHVTREAGGSVVIAESAQVDGRYGLRAFEAINAQLGHRGSVSSSDDGRRLSYQLVENGVTSTATEEMTVPVVSGPSLHGFILQRWDTLAPGVVVPVRMVVLAEKRTYGFDIALAGQKRRPHDLLGDPQQLAGAPGRRAAHGHLRRPHATCRALRRPRASDRAAGRSAQGPGRAWTTRRRSESTDDLPRDRAAVTRARIARAC